MIITITNQKGGVGKTTLACHLAWRAREERSVLAIDLDTQANLTQTLLGRTVGIKGEAALVFGEEPLMPTPVLERLLLLPGGGALKEIDEGVELRDAIDRRSRIESLAQVIVIDTPPAIGIRQVAPYFWSDILVLVLTPDVFSLKGMADVRNTLDRVRTKNPSLRLRVVVNRHHPDAPREREVIDLIAREFEDDLVRPVLSESRTVSGAISERVSAWDYAYKSPARAKAMRAVCEAILK
jgi:chromosome partitioning protein